MIPTDVSGKWVAIEDCQQIIADCIKIARLARADAVAQVILERYTNESN